MKKIKVSEAWFTDTLRPFLEEWKEGKQRERVKGFVLTALELQRMSEDYGKKNLAHKICISVSKRALEKAFTNWEPRKKFCHLAVSMHVVEKDGSWVSKSIAKEARQDTYCNKWHITEPDIACKRHIEIEYNESLGLIGVYTDYILKAEGFDYEGDIFSGAWAIEKFNSGRMKWGDYVKIATCARKLVEGPNPSSDRFRVFDGLTGLKKELRTKCFHNAVAPDSHPIEAFDARGAYSFTAKVAAAALGFTSFQDKDLDTWAFDLICGAPKDPYKGIWNKIFELDPHTNAYGDGQWNNVNRKRIKLGVNVAENCSADFIKEAKQKYFDYFEGNLVSIRSRRLYQIYHAIRAYDVNLFECIARTKCNNVRNAFYRLASMGEKMLMDLIATKLREAGYCVHRVHDALWSSDPRAKDKVAFGKVIGKIIRDFIAESGSNGYGRIAINKMADRCITKEDKEWVLEGVNMDPRIKEIIAKAQFRTRPVK